MSTDAEKPRTQVVEESRETLTLVDQDRLPRERKLASEAEQLAEGHEIRFSERHFRARHHPQDIESIRDAVDALQVARRLPPEAAPLPPPEPEPVRAPVREDFRAALAPLVQGEIVAVEVVYRAGQGDVVEAMSERDGQRTRSLYVIENGVARPADAIEAAIDALPTPAAPPPSPEPAAAPAPEPKKKSLFGRAKKEAPPPAPSEPSEEKPAKKRFGFGRK